MFHRATGSQTEKTTHHKRAGKMCAITVSALLGLTSLAGAPSGHADLGINNWDAVAQCESGGNWHADTGNGFYGGLQFLQSTWDEFGGHGSPAAASKAEQIRVANRVLADQGPWAWPKCGPGHIYAPTVKGWVPSPLRRLTKDAFEMFPNGSLPFTPPLPVKIPIPLKKLIGG